MRDDRYKGTCLPRPMRKLCRMSERLADRCHPERLQAQALTALTVEAGAISAEFKDILKRQDQQRSFFGYRELAAAAHSSLECEIVQTLKVEPALAASDAIRTALSARSEAYVREQKCRLIADRESCATEATESVRKACHDAAADAAALVLRNERAPANVNRVRLDENLLARVAAGGVR